MKFSYCSTTARCATIFVFFLCLLPTKSVCMSAVFLNGIFASCVVCCLARNDCEANNYRAETNKTIDDFEHQLIPVLQKLYLNQQKLAQNQIKLAVRMSPVSACTPTEEPLPPISACTPTEEPLPPISACTPTEEPLTKRNDECQ